MNGLGRKKEENQNNNQMIFTKETLGVVLLLFSTLCAVCLITRDAIFSVPGAFVNSFLFGCFGVFAYAVVLGLTILGVLLIVDKKIKVSKKNKVLLTLAFFLIALIVQVISMHGQKMEYGKYLETTYNMAKDGFSSKLGGGLFMALVAYPVSLLLTEVGTYVVAGIAVLAILYFMFKGHFDKAKVSHNNGSKFRSSFVKEDSTVAGVEIQGERDYPVDEVTFSQNTAKQRLFVNNPQDFAVKNKREIAKDQSPAIKFDYQKGGLSVVDYSNNTSVKNKDDYKSKLDYIKTPPSVDLSAIRNNSTPSSSVVNQSSGYYSKPIVNDSAYKTADVADVNAVNSSTSEREEFKTTVSDYISVRKQENEEKQEQQIPYIEHNDDMNGENQSASVRAEIFGRRYADFEEVEQPKTVVEPNEVVFRSINQQDYSQTENKKEGLFDDEIIDGQEVDVFEVKREQRTQEQLPPSTVRSNAGLRNSIFGDKPIVEQNQSAERTEDEKTVLPSRTSLGYTSRVSADNNLGSRGQMQEEQEQKEKKPAPPINRVYNRPPLDLLENYTPPMDVEGENHEERKEIIKRTLEEFHINAIPQNHVQGPAITRYEIMMPAGVSVKKVLAFDDDLKMRLSAKDGVRIEAPIPGKNLVGIEVANNVKTTVGLREIMEGSAGQKSKDGSLMFALGKDLVGKPIVDDLSKGPHYLVAGATGSGKSVCLNIMIVSLIMRYSPEDLRLILVDPKGVEFINYEHIPHLMIDEIITEPKKALAVLSWAYTEMERRFSVFRESGGGLVVDIDSYNSVVAGPTVAKMPRIVIIIDELADLMETCKKDLETRIRAIAQKARAAGIHLVLATQRPSVDIITGTIKANLPSRIAFKVMNFNDSQTILSEAGAEKLLGNGDMLYKTARMSATERYQGAYISSREVNSVVNYIKENNTAYFDDELQSYLDKESRPKQEESGYDGGDNGDDSNEINDFFLKALWLAVNTETVSISQLQRRFQIGYSRAGGLVDKMERMGFVSANEGSKARRVLLTKEQFEERFGSMPD